MEIATLFCKDSSLQTRDKWVGLEGSYYAFRDCQIYIVKTIQFNTQHSLASLVPTLLKSSHEMYAIASWSASGATSVFDCRDSAMSGSQVP